VRCNACGTLFTSREPIQGQEQDYADYGYSTNSIPTFIDRRCDELVIPFNKYRKLNRFLEIGFGAGTIIRAAARAGWNVAGVEMSTAAVEVLRAKHPEFDLRCGSVESQVFDGDSFDAIAVVEVIEHVVDPAPLLAEAARLLRPGGVAWVTTPSLNSISWKILGLEWSMVAPPDHLEIYSITGVRRLLDSCGLTVRRIDTLGANPYEIISYFRNGRNGVSVSDRVSSGYELNGSLEAGSVGKTVKQAMNKFLTLTRAGDGIKAWAEKR
jgi:SAM-dependent methyltransferase